MLRWRSRRQQSIQIHQMGIVATKPTQPPINDPVQPMRLWIAPLTIGAKAIENHLVVFELEPRWCQAFDGSSRTFYRHHGHTLATPKIMLMWRLRGLIGWGFTRQFNEG